MSNSATSGSLSSGQESSPPTSPDCKPDVDGLADTDAVKPLTAKKLAALSKGHSCDCTFLVGPSSEEAQVRIILISFSAPSNPKYCVFFKYIIL
jgi:hypothetical protein